MRLKEIQELITGTQLDPAPALLGRVYYFHFVHLCSCPKIIEPINFILVEAFPLTQEGNPLDFDKIPHRVKVGVGCPKFWSNNRRYNVNFREAITAKQWEIGMWLVYTNMKSYMGSPTAPLDFTLKGQIQGHSNFEGLYLVKELR